MGFTSRPMVCLLKFLTQKVGKGVLTRPVNYTALLRLLALVYLDEGDLACVVAAGIARLPLW